MKSPKLYDLLGLIQGKELVRLRRFLDSPYFNREPRMIALMEAILGGIRDKKMLWGNVYGKAPYQDLKLRHAMSELMRLLERFLRTEELEGRELLSHSLLLRGLRRRGAEDLYQFTWRKGQRKSRPSEEGVNLFLEEHLVQAEHNSWLEARSLRSGETHLQATVDSLDTFYLFSKLKYSCTILNNRAVVDVDYQNVLLDEILQYLDQQQTISRPGIAIYHRIFQMLSEPASDQHYQELKQLLGEHATSFAAREARTMYAFALNHCIRRINKGESGFLQEIFGLYKEAIQRKSLLENGRISPWDYKNIVATGLRLNEFDWTESFIRDHKDNIEESYRENAFTYNLARLHFHKKEYSQALKLLQQVEYEDVFYNLDSRVMLLKVYFEMNETEALDSLIDSFRIFLRRNKLISAHHRRNYLNLTRFVKKLSRLRPDDMARLRKIRAEVADTSQLADADWLRGILDKVEHEG